MSLILGGFDTGWTGYPPLSARAPVGVQMFFLGVFTAGWSSILGALNMIATVIRMRAKGMTAMRMPIFVWAAIATSIIALTATQLIGLSFQLVMFQRLFGMGFFDPAKGGNPVLFQHLFWFYSHPAVYVFVLPGLGCDLRTSAGLCPQAVVWLSLGRHVLAGQSPWSASWYGRIICLPPV